ncbi:MAG: hypothetical protein EAX96_10895 [Candidatus Lokiarchaeota archaeon]|nr:hypothetical protein [Candidatus Lokiarchaeota archaeon]
MKKKLGCLTIFLLLSFCIGTLVVNPTNATYQNSFGLAVGDWWVMYTAKSLTIPQSEGNYTKYQVNDINESYINYGGQWYWVDAIWADLFSANITNMTWKLIVANSNPAIFNATNTNWLGLSGGGLFSFGIMPSLVYPVACTNFTKNNLSIYFQLGILGINNSRVSGTTWTYWNGKTNGDGATNISQKYELVFDTSKYVTISSKIYKWNNETNTWQLKEEGYMISASWITTNSTPIPGFEFIFIALTIGIIMTLYLWRKNKIRFKFEP